MAYAGVSYPRQCINNPACDQNQRVTAIHDYVATVYVDPSRFTFDGFLSAEEEAAVVEEFGKFQVESGATFQQAAGRYLKKARDAYLASLNLEHNQLHQCEADFVTAPLESQKWGKGVFVGGAHDCGPEFGALYFDAGVELEVVADPSKWLFLVEGYGNKVGVTAAELELFGRIARVFHLPVENPLKYNTTGNEVMHEAVKRFHRKKLDYIVVILMGAFGINRLNQPSDVWGLILDKTLDRLVAMYKMDHKQLEDEFFKVLGKNSQETKTAFLERLASNWEAIFTAAELRLMGRMEELIRLANEMNVAHIRQLLAKYPSRKRIFFQAGKGHLPLAEKVFSP